MNRIVSKEFLSENVFKIEIEAPQIAKNRKPGHFVIVKVGNEGERIPLTIVDSDPEQGTVLLIVQRVGVSSHKLGNLSVGDSVTDVLGPLGHATHIDKFGTVVATGGGLGLAPTLPIIRAMKKAGNRVVSVMAARSKDLLILEDEFRAVSDELIIMTDDGSYGQKGLVTQGLDSVINNEKVDLVLTIGPAVMMKYVSLLTEKYSIPTVASLNTIMVDGTGMCGACRVSIGNETKFVCVDGPEFDAHKVDFDGMISRLGAFKSEEEKAYKCYLDSVTLK